MTLQGLIPDDLQYNNVVSTALSYTSQATFLMSVIAQLISTTAIVILFAQGLPISPALHTYALLSIGGSIISFMGIVTAKAIDDIASLIFK